MREKKTIDLDIKQIASKTIKKLAGLIPENRIANNAEKTKIQKHLSEAIKKINILCEQKTAQTQGIKHIAFRKIMVKDKVAMNQLLKALSPENEINIDPYDESENTQEIYLDYMDQLALEKAIQTHPEASNGKLDELISQAIDHKPGTMSAEGSMSIHDFIRSACETLGDDGTEVRIKVGFGSFGPNEGRLNLDSLVELHKQRMLGRNPKIEALANLSSIEINSNENAQSYLKRIMSQNGGSGNSYWRFFKTFAGKNRGSTAEHLLYEKISYILHGKKENGKTKSISDFLEEKALNTALEEKALNTALKDALNTALTDAVGSDNFLDLNTFEKIKKIDQTIQDRINSKAPDVEADAVSKSGLRR